MSVEATMWALRQKCATATEKAVLLVVANYAGADGMCWPGQATVAAQACCSIKTVERCLARFEELGWILRTRRYREGGYRTSDLIELPQDAAPEPVKSLSDRLSVRPSEVPENDLTRHPDQSYPTSCPILPDRVSEQEPLDEPLDEQLGAAAAISRAQASAENLGEDGWPLEIAKAVDLLVLMADTVRLDPRREPALRSTELLENWRGEGVSFVDTVIPCVMALSRQNGQPITAWAHFEHWVEESHDCWTAPL